MGQMPRSTERILVTNIDGKNNNKPEPVLILQQTKWELGETGSHQWLLMTQWGQSYGIGDRLGLGVRVWSYRQVRFTGKATEMVRVTQEKWVMEIRGLQVRFMVAVHVGKGVRMQDSVGK